MATKKMLAANTKISSGLPQMKDVLKLKVPAPIVDSVVYEWTVKNWSELKNLTESDVFQCAGLDFEIILFKKGDGKIAFLLFARGRFDTLDVHVAFLMSNPSNSSIMSAPIGWILSFCCH